MRGKGKREKEKPLSKSVFEGVAVDGIPSNTHDDKPVEYVPYL